MIVIFDIIVPKFIYFKTRTTPARKMMNSAIFDRLKRVAYETKLLVKSISV